MLIESLAQKTKLAMMTVLASIAGSVIICGFTVWCCVSLVNKERQQIYVLDGDIPFLAERAQLEANFTMEAKVGKAMYMADGTALKQKQAMDENGFYTDIISSSAVCTIMCDSIQFDEHERKFTYYGTQLIKRRTRDLKRTMVTTGYIENVPRTRNNPHGLMIVNWRTLENKDLDY